MKTNTELFNRAHSATSFALAILERMDQAHTITAEQIDTVDLSLREAAAAVTSLKNRAHQHPEPKAGK
jgi:hypothetical protein